MGLRWRLARGVQEGSAVTAAVDGIEVTVSSADAPLRSTVEAWATAFVLPAARASATLVPDGPIDARWARGAAANVALAASWWGGDRELPIDARRSRRRPRHPAPGRALCFTGGVDSFFSLLRGDHRPTHLLYVQGFDIRLDDEARASAVDAMVRSVAASRGLEPIVMRTDLLSHPHFSSISWEHTHGAALAAMAQLLAPVIGAAIVPPSYAAERLVPWGSRPDTDPRWGVPGRTTIVHGDASGRRLDRVHAIADDPLVHRHLRVCWANVGDDLNCGRCEKCARTMAMLSSTGQLDRCTTFPTAGQLPDVIDDLGALPTGALPMWSDLLPLDLASPVRGAVERLLARSG